MVMRPAVEAIQEGRRLQDNGHSGAAVVFFVTAIELLLKATLLKPVVDGLVHSAGLAEIIVSKALGAARNNLYSKSVQRNGIIHHGKGATSEQAEIARLVSIAVYDLIVVPMIAHLGLKVAARGEIKT